MSEAIGKAWYYPEDRVLVLWECFLESFVRDRALRKDEHMTLKGNAVQPWTYSF